MAQYFQEKGLGAIEAAGAAQGVIWNTILRQSTLNAILDTVDIYIILHLLVIPVVFLLKKKNTQD